MAEAPPGSTYWLFQGNPKRYDLREKLKPGQTEQWVVTRYVTRIQPGDIVWFWRSGERALYGWGEVLEPPQSVPGLSGIRTPIRYVERFDPPSRSKTSARCRNSTNKRTHTQNKRTHTLLK